MLVENKKTILVTSIGLCFVGTFLVALRNYYRSKKKKQQSESAKQLTKTKSTRNGAKLNRPQSLTEPTANNTSTPKISSSTSLSTSGNSKQLNKEKTILLTKALKEANTNLPGEELLELGLNYLNQAIRCWETAIDSIESAAYMQSQTLALPNDEHADLVFQLRSLLDKANEINVNTNLKPIKSSQTLQIIQSRLAYKQQLYTEVLLKTNPNNVNNVNNNEEHETTTTTTTTTETATLIATTPKQIINNAAEAFNGRHVVSSPVGSLNKRYGYLSDDDNESFVSADSDVDWLDEEMLQRIENVNDKNALYEMGLSSASLGRVTYRVSRYEMFNCKSNVDFAAKLHAVRLGFDRLLQENEKREWMIEQGRRLVSALLRKNEKDCTGFYKAYDEIIKFATQDGDWKQIKDELATRDVMCLNFFDIVIDFILLDAFDDLENPPTAITTVIQNRWLSQSFKETALSTAVWSVLKAKRKLLKYPNGFISRFYSITEYLVPVLAWGFLGTDKQLNESCMFMKNNVIEYLNCLFDLERTRYTNLEEISADIETHTIKYLEEIFEKIA